VPGTRVHGKQAHLGVCMSSGKLGCIEGVRNGARFAVSRCRIVDSCAVVLVAALSGRLRDHHHGPEQPTGVWGLTGRA
jgi:hypothetical protein